MATALTSSFNFWVPIDKAASERGGDGDERWVVRGRASTGDKDLQNEVVVQKGIDLDYFLKYGTFNWDHKSDPKYLVGYPSDARIEKGGMFVEGYLLKGKPIAEEVWEHLKAEELTKSSRRLGMSIQGRVVHRADNRIERCWLTAVAITAHPINPATYVEMAKSLCLQSWCRPEEVDLARATQRFYRSLEGTAGYSEMPRVGKSPAGAMSTYGDPDMGPPLESDSADDLEKEQAVRERGDAALRRALKGPQSVPATPNGFTLEQVADRVMQRKGYSRPLAMEYAKALARLAISGRKAA